MVEIVIMLEMLVPVPRGVTCDPGASSALQLHWVKLALRAGLVMSGMQIMLTREAE